jgi:hypothetical protein
MDIDQKRHLTFPLRLPLSMRDAATELAHKDGVSLNHFISLAVAEKISRLEQNMLTDHHHAASRPITPIQLQLQKA